MFINVTGLKRQLNIESDYTADDILLQLLCDAAEQAVINYCNAVVSDTTGSTTGTTLNLSGSTMNLTITDYTKPHTDVSIAVVQAAYLLAAHLYVNRQVVSFSQGVEIPFTISYLLDPYKNWVII
jgi:hypothetical protein